jgi:hypothetical protein
MLYRYQQILTGTILAVICLCLFTFSEPRLVGETDHVRVYTRDIEFDYVSWMFNAIWVKIQQGATGTPGYISREDGKAAVTDYLLLTQQVNQAEDALNRIYADASIKDKVSATAHLRAQIADLTGKQTALAPIAESVLQEQVSEVAASFGLTTLGQPIPSILFHSTPVPDALIISPRDHIEQTVNISLRPDLSLDQEIALEEHVSQGLNVSALVVPIGGVGVYPTMIMQTTDLSWLTNTIAHEWTHNYLELRPLGLLYDETPELRTMNETTADISGGEIGAEVMRRYYPELANNTLIPNLNLVLFNPFNFIPAGTTPVFDFNHEMHLTRVTVDALLAAGKIDEAESYMEQRRQVFVQNGYTIRKLNQAYFAFYGAYADVPGGAAGEDPVGPAVRALRAQSKSLADFINRIAWMTSFDELRKAVGQ